MLFIASAGGATWRRGALCMRCLLHGFVRFVRACDVGRSGSVTIAGACSAV